MKHMHKMEKSEEELELNLTKTQLGLTSEGPEVGNPGLCQLCDTGLDFRLPDVPSQAPAVQ